MDRDLALKVVEALEAIQVAVETIAVNTAPATPEEPTAPAEGAGT